jgi:hypothetical protein
VGAEVPKHATLKDALEPEPVLGLEEAGFVKVSLPVVTPVDSGEDAVDNNQVEVEVWVQGRAEAVQEADGAGLGLGGRTGTCVAKRGPDRAQEDPEDGTRDVGIVMQERPEAFGDREDPLPDGEVGQHVIREMRCELGHTTGVAGGTDAPALAGKRDQALVAEVLAAGAGKPVGEDAAPQVGSEVLLHPPGHAAAQGIDLRGPGQEGLQGPQGPPRRKRAAQRERGLLMSVSAGGNPKREPSK